MNGVQVERAESVLEKAERLGRGACDRVPVDKRSSLGQFFTPSALAKLMAGMFSDCGGRDVRLLDPGAGAGSLTAAFVAEILSKKKKPRRLHLSAWEVEEEFLPVLRTVLEECVENAEAAGVPATFELKNSDFLEDAAELLDDHSLFKRREKHEGFTHAILNPPYRKIQTTSHARRILRRSGLETSNLYTGFLWLSARLLTEGGELVAITPRSFSNGPYFLPFRKSFFEKMALHRVHVFDRRDIVFSDDEVLQENLIMYAVRSLRVPCTVTLSSSEVAEEEVRSRSVPYATVLDSRDSNRILH